MQGFVELRDGSLLYLHLIMPMKHCGRVRLAVVVTVPFLHYARKPWSYKICKLEFLTIITMWQFLNQCVFRGFNC